MNKLIAFCDKYTIRQLSEGGLHELAGFVVRENDKLHANARLNTHFDAEVEPVYDEEVRYFNHSWIFPQTHTYVVEMAKRCIFAINHKTKHE